MVIGEVTRIGSIGVDELPGRLGLADDLGPLPRFKIKPKDKPEAGGSFSRRRRDLVAIGGGITAKDTLTVSTRASQVEGSWAVGLAMLFCASGKEQPYEEGIAVSIDQYAQTFPS